MWYQSLRSKFKNFRQNLNNIKIVADNKKKYGKDSYKNVTPAAAVSEIDTIVNVERVQVFTHSFNSLNDVQSFF